MFADQIATGLVGITVPTGAEPGLPPAPTLTADTPALISIAPGAVTNGGGGFNDQLSLTITGNGTPGQTGVHCEAYGVDQSDLLVILLPRPTAGYAFEVGSFTISDPPAPPAPAAS
jgi:hypothetical protein